MAEVNTRTENSENVCLEAEFLSKSAGFLSRQLDLEFQCADVWERGQGLLFGVNESVFNGALALRQMENNMSQGDFMYGYFAKYNQETEDIHYLSGLSKVESMSIQDTAPNISS